MFAYIVVVVTLVSMAIFLLFWLAPLSPAQPICDRETSNRCSAAKLEIYERTLGYQNPVYEEYIKDV